uniref:Uncharacterized protein n=1 Tax=Arundo donax TaxID=35708 RepID=A0A0A9BA87_ARUDO
MEGRLPFFSDACNNGSVICELGGFITSQTISVLCSDAVREIWIRYWPYDR